MDTACLSARPARTPSGQCGAFYIGSVDGDERYVLCDEYKRVRLVPDAAAIPLDTIRGKSGMPMLYYKADTSKIHHSKADADLGISIYSYFGPKEA